MRTKEEIKAELNDTDFEVKCRGYLLKRLETLRKSIRATTEKEREAHAEKTRQLAQYEDFDDLQDAYGNGLVSAEEFDRARDLLKSIDRHELTPKMAALEMLTDFMRLLRSDIKSLEWERLPEEEKERIHQSNEAYRCEIQEKEESMNNETE